MKNLVKLIEIPATDFARAVNFYETVLGIKLTVCDSCESEKMLSFQTLPKLNRMWLSRGLQIFFPRKTVYWLA